MADDGTGPTRPVDAPAAPGGAGPEPSVDDRAAAILHDAEAAAALRGRAMVDEARAVRQRMLEDVERRRQSLVAELRRVREALDELAAGLEEPPALTTVENVAPPRRAAPDPTTEPATHADDVFARLREERDRAPATGRPSGAQAGPRGPTPPDPAREAPPPMAEPEVAAVAEPPPLSGDDATRRRRDEVLAPLTTGMLRGAKRLLQDEHNELLDAVRRVRGRLEPARLLPDPEKQHAGWSAVLAPTIDEAYTVGRALTGRRRRPTSAPTRLVAELAAGIVTPLRERLTATMNAVAADGPYESTAELQAALGPAISARYREWRARDLEGLLGDLLAAAYTRGVFDATPSGALLRWVPAEVGQCPDADDNALEPTVKGQAFPTGQPYPPAHPGCRCLVVPSDVGTAGRHV